MDIPNQTSTVMSVWLAGSDWWENWECGECKNRGVGPVPKVCPGCLLPVLANVVYGRNSVRTYEVGDTKVQS